MLTAMQYGSFVWPHNPKTYTIRFTRLLVQHALPFASYAIEDLGLGARVMEGEGEFFGANAYQTFGRLASLFYKQQPRQLLHPLWQSSNVYFQMLQLLEEPRADYVRYAFRFVEAPSGSARSVEAAADRVTLSAGQTLWDVAQQHGLTVEALLECNPALSTCNDARPGSEVRLR